MSNSQKSRIKKAEEIVKPEEPGPIYLFLDANKQTEEELLASLTDEERARKKIIIFKWALHETYKTPEIPAKVENANAEQPKAPEREQIDLDREIRETVWRARAAGATEKEIREVLTAPTKNPEQSLDLIRIFGGGGRGFKIDEG